MNKVAFLDEGDLEDPDKCRGPPSRQSMSPVFSGQRRTQKDVHVPFRGSLYPLVLSIIMLFIVII